MMIELPQRCFIGRVNPRWFARVRPLFINYTGSETLTEMQVECVLSSSDIPFEKLRPDKEDLLFVDQNNEVIPHFIKEQNNSEIKLLLKFHISLSIKTKYTFVSFTFFVPIIPWVSTDTLLLSLLLQEQGNILCNSLRNDP